MRWPWSLLDPEATFQEFIILHYNENHKYSWARSFLYQTNSESVLGSSPMTEPCLNNPCMMTFKTRYKSLSNKMLQTWMKLFHFNLTTSGCQTDNRVAFPFWMGQIYSKAAETASSIYVRAQISTFRPLIWNTAMTVRLKHLHPCETSLQHSCLKTPLHQLHQMGEGFITDELNKSLTLSGAFVHTRS